MCGVCVVCEGGGGGGIVCVREGCVREGVCGF